MDCPICFEQISQSDPNVSTLSCKHSFHIDCVSRWFDTNESCPCCRRIIAPVEIYYASMRNQIPPSIIIDTSFILLNSPPRIHRVAFDDAYDADWETIPVASYNQVQNIVDKYDIDSYEAYSIVHDAVVKIQGFVRKCLYS